ncbi:MAG: hypothetical protein F6K47_13050 [Symploca sp. SIO2E6]|nr:hypothetical protein [Symploca sp. SIO2E6]
MGSGELGIGNWEESTALCWLQSSSFSGIIYNGEMRAPIYKPSPCSSFSLSYDRFEQIAIACC